MKTLRGPNFPSMAQLMEEATVAHARRRSFLL